jgi:hypothetical protein
MKTEVKVRQCWKNWKSAQPQHLLPILSLLFALAAPSFANEVLTIADKQECLGFTDEDFDRWKSMGVDGFICKVRHLRPFGGSQNFTVILLQI